MTCHRAATSQTPRHVLAAWAGVWALLLQIMVPLGQAIPATGADGLPRTLLICSATQPRSVPGPGSQAPVVPKAGACVVCAAHAAGDGAAAPSAVTLPSPPAVPMATLDPLPSALAGGVMPGLPRPRGPPRLV